MIKIYNFLLTFFSLKWKFILEKPNACYYHVVTHTIMWQALPLPNIPRKIWNFFVFNKWITKIKHWTDINVKQKFNPLAYVDEVKVAIASISSFRRRASMNTSRFSPCITSSMLWYVIPTLWSVTRPWG
jgi:hypothetical protein